MTRASGRASPRTALEIVRRSIGEARRLRRAEQYRFVPTEERRQRLLRRRDGGAVRRRRWRTTSGLLRRRHLDLGPQCQGSVVVVAVNGVIANDVVFRQGKRGRRRRRGRSSRRHDVPLSKLIMSTRSRGNLFSLQVVLYLPTAITSTRYFPGALLATYCGLSLLSRRWSCQDAECQVLRDPSRTADRSVSSAPPSTKLCLLHTPARQTQPFPCTERSV